MPGQGWSCEVCRFRDADLQLGAAGRLGPYIGTVQIEAPTFRISFHGSGVCARAKTTSGETAVRLSITTASVQDCTDVCTADEIRIEKTPSTNAGVAF